MPVGRFAYELTRFTYNTPGKALRIRMCFLSPRLANSRVMSIRVQFVHWRVSRGRYLEVLGQYNMDQDSDGHRHLVLNLARTKYWLGVGAEMGSHTRQLFQQIGLVPKDYQPLPSLRWLRRTDKHLDWANHKPDRPTYRIPAHEPGPVVRE